MPNIEILRLKPEYQKMVMENQQKYNPDFNSVLNEDEIGVLMTEVKVASEDELMQGLKVEKEESVPAESKIQTEDQLEQELASLKEKRKALVKEQELLQIYKKDMENGTIVGLKKKSAEKTWGLGFRIGGAIGAFPTAFGVIGTFAAAVMGEEGTEIFRDVAKFTGISIAGTAALGAAIGGIITVIKNGILKNPKNEQHQDYVSTLPQMVSIQEQKCNTLEAEIRNIESRLSAV